MPSISAMTTWPNSDLKNLGMSSSNDMICRDASERSIGA
jgi:hypothetical protein